MRKQSVYRYHAGSIIVAQGSPEGDTALSIVRCFERDDIDSVDVTFFGNVAGYQAFKACLIATEKIRSRHGVDAVWVPCRRPTYEVRRINGEWVYNEELPREVSMWTLQIKE